MYFTASGGASTYPLLCKIPATSPKIGARGLLFVSAIPKRSVIVNHYIKILGATAVKLSWKIDLNCKQLTQFLFYCWRRIILHFFVQLVVETYLQNNGITRFLGPCAELRWWAPGNPQHFKLILMACSSTFRVFQFIKLRSEYFERKITCYRGHLDCWGPLCTPKPNAMLLFHEYFTGQTWTRD